MINTLSVKFNNLFVTLVIVISSLLGSMKLLFHQMLCTATGRICFACSQHVIAGSKIMLSGNNTDSVYNAVLKSFSHFKIFPFK